MKPPRLFFNGHPYRPCVPVADTDELAEKGRRLMVVHTYDGPIIAVAQEGVMSAGWVIGIFE